MRTPKELNLAILYWTQDMEIPVDLHFALMALGLDVDVLEQTYRN